MLDNLLILLIALSNMLCGLGIGYLCGIIKERTDWNNKLADKGILPSNWHRVRIDP